MNNRDAKLQDLASRQSRRIVVDSPGFESGQTHALFTNLRTGYKVFNDDDSDNNYGVDGI